MRIALYSAVSSATLTAYVMLALELPQQECDDLVERHRRARCAIATTIVGTSGEGEMMYCRAIPTA